VQGRAAFPAVLGDGEEGRVSEELAVLDQLVDADDLLLDDASGPMLRCRLPTSPDSRAGARRRGPRRRARMRIGREDGGEDLGMGEGDRVAGIVAPDAPAVADDQDEWRSHGTQGLAGTAGTVHVETLIDGRSHSDRALVTRRSVRC
jgi:hypothetical protein